MTANHGETTIRRMNLERVRGRVTSLVICLALAMAFSACSSKKRVIGNTAPPQVPQEATPTSGELTPEDSTEVSQEVIPEEPAKDSTIETPSPDLLTRITQGFDFPDFNTRDVKKYERWNASHPTYLRNLFARAEPFLFYIVEEVEKRDMPMEIVLLPAVESAFKSRAVSRSSAAGLWQFVPATGRYFGLEQSWWYDGRHDVIKSTQAALDYLQALNKMFDGDWFITLAAYNAGPGTLKRAIERNKRKGRKTDYLSLKLRSETRRYVPKLVALKNILLDPDKHGVKLPKMANVPYFEVIDLSSQVELAVFARKANLNLDQLLNLNQGYRRWATPPGKGFHLVVPIRGDDNIAATTNYVDIALAATPKVEYLHYVIQRGDTLSGISKKHGVSVAALKTSNNIKGSRITAGKNLLIPIPLQPSQTTLTADAANGQQKKVVHQVTRGDTLWSIARQYKVKLEQLLSWNGLSAGQVLNLNQKLTVFLQ